MRTTFAAMALAASIAFCTPAAAQTTPVDTTPTIAADGIGFATLTPDIADFTAAIRATASTSAKARDAANRRVAAVVTAARTNAVAADDIRTVRLTVSRETVKRKGKKSLIRYTARQSLQIRSRDVAKLGVLLDAVSDAAADQVEAPDFGFADPSQGRLLATRAALADARRRADDAAAVQGLRITGVRSTVLAPSSNEYEVEALSVGGGSDQSAREKTAASTPTSIAPGTQQFAEQVRVVYTAAPLT